MILVFSAALISSKPPRLYGKKGTIGKMNKKGVVGNVDKMGNISLR